MPDMVAIIAREDTRTCAWRVWKSLDFELGVVVVKRCGITRKNQASIPIGSFAWRSAFPAPVAARVKLMEVANQVRVVLRHPKSIPTLGLALQSHQRP